MATHHVPRKIYFAVFAALMILTGVTVWVAFFDLGAFNDVAALGIACTKALLVVLYFMHVRYSSPLTWAFVGAGFLFLIILFAFTMSDILTREWPASPSGWSTN